MENNTAKTRSSDNGRAGLIGLGALLILSILGNIYLFNTRNKAQLAHEEEVDSLVTVRVMLQNEFNTTASELNKYKGLSTELDMLLTGANQTITEKEEAIKKLQKQLGISSAAVGKLRKELAELKLLKEGYLEQIDSILIQNKSLKEKNLALTTEKEVMSKKIEDASALRTEYVHVSTFRKKSNDKFTATTMAKRTDKVEVCFSVLDNKIAPAGQRMLHVKVISPSGKVVGGGTETFNNKTTQEPSPFTGMKTIEFAGEKQDICVDHMQAERGMESGTYIIQIYLDGVLTSNTFYELK